MLFSWLVHAIGFIGIAVGLLATVVALLEIRKGRRLAGVSILLIGVICMVLGAALIGFFRWLFFWVGGSS